VGWKGSLQLRRDVEGTDRCRSCLIEEF
jgi:hypothetical protein